MGGNQSSGGAAPVAASPLELAAGQFFDELADSEKILTAVVFEHFFSGPVPGFGTHLFKSLFGEGNTRISRSTFVSSMQQLLARDARQSASVAAYLSVYCEGDRVQTAAILACASQLAVRLSAGDREDEGTVSAKDDRFLEAVTKALSAGCEAASRDSVSEWVLCNMAGLFDSVHCWLERTVWSASGQANTSAVFALPQLVTSSGAGTSSSIITPHGMWVLSTFLPPCYLGHHKATTAGASSATTSVTGASAGGLWNALYNSREQGLSMNRFKHHVMDYRGPSVCLVSCGRDRVFAVAVDCEWRESASTWGQSDCVLAQLLPVFVPIASGSKLLMLNEKTRGVRLGLSVGRDMARPSLTIDESLDKVCVVTSPGTREELSVHAIEVWGCGGADLQEAQRKQKAWDLKQVERRRHVKRPGRWEENPDAMLLEWGGVHTTSNFGVDRAEEEKD